MQNQLKQIFVPIEIAKLARQKGFNQWCACMVSEERGHTPNFCENKTNGCTEILFNTNASNHEIVNHHYPCPSHTQLIMWLVEHHSIEVQLQMNGLFTVCDALGGMLWGDDENQFEINDAIFHALNLI